MNEQKPLTEEELRELKANSRPDDSVHVPQYEGTTAVEAAKIVEILEKRIGRLDEKEAEQLQTMQDIADKGGLTVDDVKSGNGPFRSDQDMLKGDSK